MDAVSGQETLDVVGIGFGPSGIAFAAAIEDSLGKARGGISLRAKFYERCSTSAWHPDFMLDGSDINNHFLRDLATPRDPRSQYTFANYLKTKGRLYDFGLLGRPPSRQEWSDYIEWVARQLSKYVCYNEFVEDVRPVMSNGALAGFVIESSRIRSLATNIVLSVGAEPFIPEPFRALVGSRIFHTSRFLTRVAALRKETARFVVIGAGQSAGEAIFDLRRRFPNAQITGIQRSSGFKLYDLGHFSNLVFSPDETEYFYGLPQHNKAAAFAETVRTNYSGLDYEISAALYQQMYEDRVAGSPHITLRTRCKVDAIRAENGNIHVHLIDAYSGQSDIVPADAVVLATGFRVRAIPDFMERVRPLMLFDRNDEPLLNRDYSLKLKPKSRAGLYLNGLCEHSHGIGEGQSFSMLALRGDAIFKSILERAAANRGCFEQEPSGEDVSA
jgi:L-ornithine N5-monooxygenase